MLVSIRSASDWEEGAFVPYITNDGPPFMSRGDHFGAGETPSRRLINMVIPNSAAPISSSQPATTY